MQTSANKPNKNIVFNLILFLFIFRKVYERKSKICPVCGKKVVNLPRHLRSKRHKWSAESAIAATGNFDLRVKSQKEVRKSTKDYQRRRLLCPIRTCMKVVINLSEHLKLSHKMERSQEYYRLLKEADVYNPTVIPKAIEASPRKLLKKSHAPQKVISKSQKSISIQCNMPNSPQGNEQNNCNEKKEPRAVSQSCQMNVAVDHSSSLSQNHNVEDILLPTIEEEEEELILPDKVASLTTSFKIPRLRQRVEHRQENNAINESYDSEDDNDGEDDNDDDYVPHQEDIDEINLINRCAPSIEGLFSKCKNFLSGPDGELRNLKSVHEVINDVQRICLIIEAHADIKPLFNTETIRDRYITDHCKNLKPGSIKKYLKSLLDFYTFLLTEQISVKDVFLEDVLNIKLRVAA